ncbi:MAG: PIN domain-containing protein [Pyrinomonadaceae bacterium]|nr:PIN domain-containing protein [Pyrinomonadaceae bacterium]MDQ3133398.1 PIN domain-containing protein [Acidobacteriota bacterium]
MPTKQLTFLDASVLINAARGSEPARKMRAISVIGDPNREFVGSQYLKLEVLPIAVLYKKKKEVALYERYFSAVITWVDPVSLIVPAYDLACQYGLGAMDALHLMAAMTTGAEFVSAEKPTKPIYSAYASAVSIY